MKPLDPIIMKSETVPFEGRTAGSPRGRSPFRLSLLLLLALPLLAGCRSTPTFMVLEADPLLEYAEGRFEAEKWADAIQALDRFLFAYPGHERTPEARMLLARAHFAQEEFITSAAEFERILQRFPSHGLVPEASLGICQSFAALAPVSQRDQGYTQRAVDACRDTMNEFPGMNVAEQARDLQREMINRLAQREYEEGLFYERRGLFDSAIGIYQELVDFYPQTVWAPRGFLALYRSYLAINWQQEAEQAKSRLLSNYPDSPEAAELRGPGEGSTGSGGTSRER
jgi:outer membrane protein assembly factor BamD